MIAMLGGLVGCQREAEAAGRPAARRISIASGAAAARFPRRPRVFFEEWDEPLISGIRWVEELVDDRRRRRRSFPSSPTRGLAKDRIVDPAEVARRDPQVDLRVVVRQEGEEGDDPSAARLGRASRAVRDDRIFEIKSTYILQPGPASLTDGVRQIHAILPPRSDSPRYTEACGILDRRRHGAGGRSDCSERHGLGRRPATPGGHTARTVAHQIDVLITGVGMVATAALVLARAGPDALRPGAEPAASAAASTRALEPRHRRARRVRSPRRARRRGRRCSFCTLEELRAASGESEFFSGASNLDPPSNAALERPAGRSTASRVNTVHGNERIDRRRRSSGSNRRSRALEGAAFMSALPDSQAPVRAGARRSRTWSSGGTAASWKMAGRDSATSASAALRIIDQRMKLSLGFSPCPNDCFMFDAIVQPAHRSRRARVLEPRSPTSRR